MATELFFASFDGAADLAAYDLRTSGNTDTRIVSENGNGVLDIALDRYADEVSYRSEVELIGKNKARFAEIGKTYTYSFDMRLGKEWVHDDHPEIVFQLHSSPDAGDGTRGPLLALQLMPSLDRTTTYYSIVQRADERAISEDTITSHVTTTVGNIDGDLGDWVNWRFEIHLSPGDDGRLVVWKDDTVVLQQERQANCFNDQKGPYAKWGVYKWDWRQEPTIATSRSVQFDNLRIVEGEDATGAGGIAPLASLSSAGKSSGASAGNSLSPYVSAAAESGRSSGIDMKGDYGDGTLMGTPFDDYLHDSWGNDILYGGAGDDRLASGLGADVVYGGAGNDRIELGDGDDIGYGEDGDDLLIGGPGNDRLSGGPGNDKLQGGPGNDILDGGGGGQDLLVGGAGADRFVVAGDTTLRDFSRSEGDKIDLSAFGSLTYIATTQFSASGVAEVRLEKGRLLIDSDGDGTHEYQAVLAGPVDLPIGPADLILG